MSNGLAFSQMAGADGRWALCSAKPAADLAGLVLEYQGYIEQGGPVLSQRQVSTTVIPVIVNLGPAFRVDSAGQSGGAVDFGSFVAGLDGGHAAVAATGASHCMQVDFTPLGAYRFFGLPMRELSGYVLPLGDVLKNELAALEDRLYETADWRGRIAILDSFVRARLRRSRPPSAEIVWAWQRLHASHGRTRISDLTAALDCSRKHLGERFSREIGRPPKTAARLLRFEHLHGLIGGAATPDWSALAYDCGYADQAHMVRVFRHFAGTTPTGYLSEQRLI